MMHVQSCYFANVSLLLFSVLVAVGVASASEDWRHNSGVQVYFKGRDLIRSLDPNVTCKTCFFALHRSETCHVGKVRKALRFSTQAFFALAIYLKHSKFWYWKLNWENTKYVFITNVCKPLYGLSEMNETRRMGAYRRPFLSRVFLRIVDFSTQSSLVYKDLSKRLYGMSENFHIQNS